MKSTKTFLIRNKSECTITTSANVQTVFNNNTSYKVSGTPSLVISIKLDNIIAKTDPFVFKWVCHYYDTVDVFSYIQDDSGFSIVISDDLKALSCHINQIHGTLMEVYSSDFIQDK